MMKKKINIDHAHEGDMSLIKELLDIMHVFKLDYTNTFIDIQNKNINKYDFIKSWITKLDERKKLNKTNEDQVNINPRIIPRNHIIDKILNESDNNDFSNLVKITDILKNPYNNIIPNEFITPPKEEERIHQTFCGT